MGITGLLPILKNNMKKTHISSFSNKRIGIDGFAWLYQILNSIPEELYFNLPTNKHIHMFEKKIKLLLKYDIIPVVVFDGDSLPSKEKTNLERKMRKEKSKAEVEFHLKNNNYPKAKDAMKRCISVTKNIVHDIVTMLTRNNIEYFIAPYEADSQLYFLEKIKYIDCIITEDSDLIPFGCKNILFKFDSSYVDHYTVQNLVQAKDNTFKDYIQDICILSGCDYADSIPGIGIQTAYKLVSKTKDIKNIITLVKHKKNVPDDYEDMFRRAKLTFQHQIVYDPVHKKRKHINPVNQEYPFLGTLEEIPYSIEIPLPNKIFFKTKPCDNKDNNISQISIQRHFKPKKKEVISLGKSKEKSTGTNIEYTVDENLSSPYF